MTGIDAARAAAWDALTGFDAGTIDRVADWIDACGLDQRDNALARELALGVVRHRALYDFVAATFLRPGPQPPELLRTLRLLCHQLFALDRVPPHAAVDAAVELLHRAGMSKLSGVANAVARKLVTVRDPQGLAMVLGLPAGLLAMPWIVRLAGSRPRAVVGGALTTAACLAALADHRGRGGMTPTRR